METIKELEKKIELFEAMKNIEGRKRRDEFIKYFKIDVDNIGVNAWGNHEIDNILERGIESLRTEIESKEDILNVIAERISICEKAYKVSKKDKWIHIKVVLIGIISEVTGKLNSVKYGGSE